KGMVWTESISPFKVHLLSLGQNEKAEEIYNQLNEKGIEVLFDDREASAGEKFADSDLLGIPYRIIVSEKSLNNGGVEIKKRNEQESRIVSIDELLSI
ncbi:MAG: prolyl-tRNA synthetase, partial [Candidatus Pacebacteria bacterium]|nr:prolyl-tRNA synthetase [Candidatus Paceibacterota bacterium]